MKNNFKTKWTDFSDDKNITTEENIKPVFKLEETEIINKNIANINTEPTSVETTNSLEFSVPNLSKTKVSSAIYGERGNYNIDGEIIASNTPVYSRKHQNISKANEESEDFKSFYKLLGKIFNG